MTEKNKKWQRPTLLVLTKPKDSTSVLVNCKAQCVGPTTPNATAGQCTHTSWGSVDNLCEHEGIPSDCYVRCDQAKENQDAGQVTLPGLVIGGMDAMVIVAV